MIRFAALLNGLVFAHARNAKLRLLEDYFANTPDPDRGWGLAALAREVDFPAVKPALVRDLVTERVDPVLFDYAYDYVGDLAETVALIWPDGATPAPPPGLSQVVDRLRLVGRAEAPDLVAGWLDGFDPATRWAFLKLAFGALRVGVSSRLAKTALARFGGVDVNEIERLWHGVEAPYGALFAWLEGRSGRPDISGRVVFSPLMLAHPIEEGELAALDPAAFRAEWKWDGIRVQLAAHGGRCRLFSRSGDDIGAAFPEIVEGAPFDAVIDGELMVAAAGAGGGGFAAAPFARLQRRLNRKTVGARMLASHPAFVRAYDLLAVDGEDLRERTFVERRRRLETWLERTRPERIDLSPELGFATWDDAARLRARAETAVEGLMLKRADSAYLVGRPKGAWFKWKRDPRYLDCVVMYAQRGHGKRSSYYSDYTFGLWRGTDAGAGEELVPVGKAYFGFTDRELARLDGWVRRHTAQRFGPVREVEPTLVVEVAFDSVNRSTRHKSGVAMRFPRFHRIRWDKPAAEADRLAALEALVES